jgi:hypothetical protein
MSEQEEDDRKSLNAESLYFHERAAARSRFPRPLLAPNDLFASSLCRQQTCDAVRLGRISPSNAYE